MNKANIYVHGVHAGILAEVEPGRHYRFDYLQTYTGPPVSLTMPIKSRSYTFSAFPAFFDGLLPEGAMLDGLLSRLKIDRTDYFAQLLATGEDMVGAVTCLEANDE
ncbi:MAG: HipA N-terminal domain-containing protein [Saprospiraceae bacterium]|jgi:serine/threonine-protein kinase HipA|nr:HipA N-terminal domain-containing protein [Saprospiraceae bacterium]